MRAGVVCGVCMEVVVIVRQVLGTEIVVVVVVVVVLVVLVE